MAGFLLGDAMVDTPDLNAPVAAAQAQKGQLSDLYSGQRTETGDYLNRLSGFVNSRPTSQALSERIGGEIGLPQLRSNSQALNNTLFNLPQTYSKATQGFNVTQNALDRAVGTKQAQLAPAAALASQNTLNAENQLSQRMGYEQQDFQNQLLPYQSEQGLLSDRLARESTGYSNQMQNELSAIIAKMNGGITLSEGEKNRANQLAVAEQNFQHSMELQKQSQGAQGANTQVIEVGGHKKLINTQTGQVIQDLGSTSSGSGGSSGYYPTATQSTPSVFTNPTSTISNQGFWQSSAPQSSVWR
jgi:hypothetical protein